MWKSKFYGAFVLNHRVVLHAIDATPARWRGDAGSSPLDRARTHASSPRNDLVKNSRVHPTHWLISTQVQDTTTDPKVQEFVYCLLASCDYDSFYSVMVREAMKLGASSKPILRAPDTAEAKNADDGDAGAKGDKGSK